MKVLDQHHGDGFSIYNSDCVDVLRGLPDAGVGYTIFSPPFASLYTYSASPRDMGNCKDNADFMAHFRYLVPELLRVTMPGRLLSFHCMQLPTSKARDGFIGQRDFLAVHLQDFFAALNVRYRHYYLAVKTARPQ